MMRILELGLLALCVLASGHAQTGGGVPARATPPAIPGQTAASPAAAPKQDGTASASTVPLPELILTGVTGLSSGHWAWITVAESGQPSKLYALRVGQKIGELELREIDFKAGAVRLRYRETDVSLNFKTHSTFNEKVRDLVASRDYVEQVRPFVEEHTRAHELREQREKERRDRERAEVERAAAAAAPPQTGDEFTPQK